jgi:hypothetical protein
MVVSSQLDAPAALTPGVRASGYQFDKSLAGPQVRSEEKNPIIAPAGNWTSVVQPVA